MEVDFQLLVTQMILGDKSAFRQLKIVSGIIIRRWAEKERQELRWIASAGKPVDYRNLLADVIDKYLEQQQDVASDFLKLKHFKAYLLEKFATALRLCFSEFVDLLKNKEQRAWMIVRDDLERRAAGWFYRRSMLLKPDCYPLFCDSVELTYSNFMKEDFVFNDSCSFKSYFFKILENKYHESLKEPYLKRIVPIDAQAFHPFIENEGEKRIEYDERQKILVEAFKQLNPGEKVILTGYFYGEKKLREIAYETGQSEENVRIKKHRALKKLFNHFKLIGYES